MFMAFESKLFQYKIFTLKLLCVPVFAYIKIYLCCEVLVKSMRETDSYDLGEEEWAIIRLIFSPCCQKYEYDPYVIYIIKKTFG